MSLTCLITLANCQLQFTAATLDILNTTTARNAVNETACSGHEATILRPARQTRTASYRFLFNVYPCTFYKAGTPQPPPPPPPPGGPADRGSPRPAGKKGRRGGRRLRGAARRDEPFTCSCPAAAAAATAIARAAILTAAATAAPPRRRR